MQDQHFPQATNSDLTAAWLVTGLMLATLLAYLIFCHALGNEFKQPLPEAQRLTLRTVFYAIAIVTFPITNLIRYIQLRLNQTMPTVKTDCRNVAKSRYLVTVFVSMSLIASIGIFGLVMFILGDDFNTLYIFVGMSALGLFLYRPKIDELEQIVAALADKTHE